MTGEREPSVNDAGGFFVGVVSLSLRGYGGIFVLCMFLYSVVRCYMPRKNHRWELDGQTRTVSEWAKFWSVDERSARQKLSSRAAKIQDDQIEFASHVKMLRALDVGQSIILPFAATNYKSAEQIGIKVKARKRLLTNPDDGHGQVVMVVTRIE